MTGLRSGRRRRVRRGGTRARLDGLRRSPASARRRERAGRTGFTLLEVIVTLAVASMLAGGMALALRGTGRVGGRIAGATETAQQRVLAAALLRGEIERAGRGGREVGGHLALRLVPGGPGGDALEIGYVASDDRAEPTLLQATFFAALDSRGRPNLYRRPPGAVRQPWLLGVTGVHLVGGRDADGRPLARSELTPGRAVAALEIELRFTEGDPVRVWASTRRVGALAAPIWDEAP